jgi:hypothetical protein
MSFQKFLAVIGFSIFLLPGSPLFTGIIPTKKSTINQKNRPSKKTVKKPTTDKKHIICITIPKSGTHLLHKCLTLLTSSDIHHPSKNGLPKRAIIQIRKLNKKTPPHHYKGFFHIPTVGPIPDTLVQRLKSSKVSRSFWSHWPYTNESARIFKRYGYANFFMIRDPRDQLVSMAFMVHKNTDGKAVPFEKALIDLIDGRQKHYIPWAVEIQAAHPVMWELGIAGFYNLYMPWMKAQNFYTVKFENLVGAAGGGSNQAQINEMTHIASHLGLKLSPEKISSVINSLFGGTHTFREGQIGSWKKYFTPEIKKIFKKTPGACQLLIDLGYENDENW